MFAASLKFNVGCTLLVENGEACEELEMMDSNNFAQIYGLVSFNVLILNARLSKYDTPRDVMESARF